MKNVDNFSKLAKEYRRALAYWKSFAKMEKRRRDWIGIAAGYSESREPGSEAIQFFVSEPPGPDDLLSFIRELKVPTRVIPVGAWKAAAGELHSRAAIFARVDGTAGNTGSPCVIVKDATNRRWVLSANHVIARNTTGDTKVFVDLPQSTQEVHVGSDVKFVPVDLNDNQTDVAVAKLVATQSVFRRFYDPVEPLASMTPVTAVSFRALVRARQRPVRKAGAVTGLTTGSATSFDASAMVEFDGMSPSIAEIEQMLVVQDDGAQPFCAPGDSGSLVVDSGTNRPLGILVARAQTGSYSLVGMLHTALAELKSKGMGDFTVVRP
ncbi:MAG: hypothetical protein JNL98_14155 [Bryobacterales bacterium]|nr:hypothetical protein [Bryobacterales bacterium]